MNNTFEAINKTNDAFYFLEAPKMLCLLKKRVLVVVCPLFCIARIQSQKEFSFFYLKSVKKQTIRAYSISESLIKNRAESKNYFDELFFLTENYFLI